MSKIALNIHEFITIKTPKEWLEHAAQNIPILLIDHAHCERKAAQTAINFMSKFPEKSALIKAMSPLAREELLHFEKVMTLIHQRGLTFGPLKPSKYGQTLHQNVATSDYLMHLSDELIIGAIIEARSCERFHALIPYLEDQELARFYRFLYQAEARHFETYLDLAQEYCPHNFENRLTKFLDVEAALIIQPDTVFRFHGGLPSNIIH